MALEILSKGRPFRVHSQIEESSVVKHPKDGNETPRQDQDKHLDKPGEFVPLITLSLTNLAITCL